MYKKTMTYTDFNGNTRTEDFYFNLTRAECTRMEMTTTGGMSEMIERIIAAQDVPSLITIFEDMIQKSYGVKTPDGRGFVKRKEDLDAFMATEAYSDLYMELVTNADAASDFINHIIPNIPEKKTSKTAPAVLPIE